VPVTTTHPDYTGYANAATAFGSTLLEAPWPRCRDAVAGSDTIKAKEEIYLPRLSGQTIYVQDGRRIDQYRNYLQRALWYNATARTLQGLIGALFRKAPVFDVPAVVREHLGDITGQGVPATAFAQMIGEEVLTTGRYGVLVDIDPDDQVAPRPWWIGYQAEQITNWRTQIIGGQQVLTLVVLKETIEVLNDDIFEIETETQYRVLSLDADGMYRIDLWRQADTRSDHWTSRETFQPAIRGSRLNYIPFVFFAPSSLRPAIEKPPLLDLVDINLSHYRSSADLEHGRHFCGLPTAWVAGFPVDTTLMIGSETAWVSSETNARAGFLEFTGQGLGALEKALEEKEAKMAAVGARLLEAPRLGVESAETIRLRTAGEHNFLQTTASTLSMGLTKLLQFHAAWMRMDNALVTAKVNDDFIDARLLPAEREALIKEVQAGLMSWSTYYWNMQRAEMYPPDRTEEEEKALIEADQPLGGRGAMEIPPDEEDEGREEAA
jgi:hypothetical protein